MEDKSGLACPDFLRKVQEFKGLAGEVSWEPASSRLRPGQNESRFGMRTFQGLSGHEDSFSPAEAWCP